ncbi:hypothetical protein H9Q70_009012 [Fusarium xylarioides]|nr:hypothetical protein H9Q70_009012 [Fusarium xylarioides]KAG5777255.1 hypothetical protein H9Q73_009073 [Fusarium xylarioides]
MFFRRLRRFFQRRNPPRQPPQQLARHRNVNRRPQFPSNRQMFKELYMEHLKRKAADANTPRILRWFNGWG